MDVYKTHVLLVINNSLCILLARQLTAMTVRKQQRETLLLRHRIIKKLPKGQKSKFK